MLRPKLLHPSRHPGHSRSQSFDVASGRRHSRHSRRHYKRGKRRGETARGENSAGDDDILSIAMRTNLTSTHDSLPPTPDNPLIKTTIIRVHKDSDQKQPESPTIEIPNLYSHAIMEEEEEDGEN
ncbi:hypothetical protein ADUPG1_000908 [Aduncisulcus paluster]|uniref:Uncharacterized protein n=1 Tax=Aduncisulcus paluster TaxID=2918883 RepID=A0ABQ5KAF0_9EUKA|nr:hypothetical protein ADUPG1_000908 [Aduncisulcus paluster]